MSFCATTGRNFTQKNTHGVWGLRLSVGQSWSTLRTKYSLKIWVTVPPKQKHKYSTCRSRVSQSCISSSILLRSWRILKLHANPVELIELLKLEMVEGDKAWLRLEIFAWNFDNPTPQQFPKEVTILKLEWFQLVKKWERWREIDQILHDFVNLTVEFRGCGQ